MSLLAPLRCTNLLAQHARSCITLAPVLPDQEDTAATAVTAQTGKPLSEHSFFGGTPLLPPDFEWPHRPFTLDGSSESQEVPLVFCLQLDLSEIAPLDERHELPDHGILAFFSPGESFNFDQPEHCFVVRYFEHPTQLVDHPRPEVAGIDVSAQALILPRLSLCAQAAWSFPYWALNYDEADAHQANQQLTPWGLTSAIMEEIYERIDELANELLQQDGIDIFADEYAERTQLLGYGHFIQDTVQNAEDTLLLALSSFFDPFKRQWLTLYGDAGALYFVLKSSALKARAFDQVRGDMQCY